MPAKYGKGSNVDNPFYPGETEFNGGKKGIQSNHGSAYNVQVHDTNGMDEALRGKGGSRPGGRKKGGRK